MFSAARMADNETDLITRCDNIITNHAAVVKMQDDADMCCGISQIDQAKLDHLVELVADDLQEIKEIVSGTIAGTRAKARVMVAICQDTWSVTLAKSILAATDAAICRPAFSGGLHQKQHKRLALPSFLAP